jgi:mono/diheme cytochrome c family protein
MAILAAAVILVAANPSARAQTRLIVDGQAVAKRDCAMCHAIGPQGDSPHTGAPPFRELHKRFTVDEMEAGMLADLLTGQPAMPSMRLGPAEIHDLLDYLKSVQLERSAEAGRIS